MTKIYGGTSTSEGVKCK